MYSQVPFVNNTTIPGIYSDKLTELGIITNRTSGSDKVKCPKCSDSRKNKHDKPLSVNVTEGVWCCHNCGFKGNLSAYEGQKEQKAYSKPPQDILKNIQLKAKATKWFNDVRAITKGTLDYFMVFTKEEYMPQTGKKETCICFLYSRDGEIVNIKYRDGSKNFKLWKDGEQIFFNLKSIVGKKSAVIVEGEIDAMSVYEAGYGKDVKSEGGKEDNSFSKIGVVSVPNGASKGNQKLQYLDNCAEYFIGLDEIILATDDDEAGISLKNELIKRLGYERCKTISYPVEKVVPLENNLKRACKDLNEVLVYFGKEVVINAIENAQPCKKEITSESTIKAISLYDKNEAELQLQQIENLKKNDTTDNDPSVGKNNPEPQKFNNLITQVENFLNLHYDLRFNEVTNRIEEKKKDAQNWKDLNENNIYRFLQKQNISYSMNKLTSLLRSDFINVFNPLEEYFKNLKHYDKLNEPDYILNLSTYINAKNPERFKVQLKKHLVRCVVCAIDNTYYNKQAFILVHEKQNSGKSTLCRWFCPPELNQYFGENVNLTNKDGEIAISEKFIINLDELAALSKYEINQLKSVMSRDKISVRRPFERSTSDSPRRCSFFGSTNRGEFLFDETGSVRWLCFEIDSINWDYKKDIDINRVWAQAYELYKSGFKYDLTAAEIEDNESANTEFFMGSPEEDLLNQMFKPGTSTDPITYDHMTCTDILKHMNRECDNALKINPIVLGRVLQKNKFVKCSFRHSDGESLKGYWVKLNDSFKIQKPTK